MDSRWEVVEVEDAGRAVFHVVPVGDMRAHKYRYCWCDVVELVEGLVVHSSLDGREGFEEGRRKLS